jgi:hypothetical protein
MAYSADGTRYIYEICTSVSDFPCRLMSAAI